MKGLAIRGQVRTVRALSNDYLKRSADVRSTARAIVRGRTKKDVL
jgi:hypothetical protein